MFLLAVMAAAAEPPTPDPALLVVAGLGPERLGVDHREQLWLTRDGELHFIAPGGEISGAVEIPRHRALDADSHWGIALIATDGRRIEILEPDGTSRTSLPLDHAVGQVSWLDAGRLAVSPTEADHAVEIWDLESRRVAQTLWPTPSPARTDGAPRLSASVLTEPSSGGRLYALDSVGGELRLFDLHEGRETQGHATEVKRDSLPAHKLPEIRRWLRESGAGPGDRPPDALFTILRLAVDAAGDTWVVTGCSDDRRSATLHRVGPAAEPVAVELDLDEPCCSLNFTVWQNHAIFTWKPPGSPARCVVTRRLP